MGCNDEPFGVDVGQVYLDELENDVQSKAWDHEEHLTELKNDSLWPDSSSPNFHVTGTVTGRADTRFQEMVDRHTKPGPRLNREAKTNEVMVASIIRSTDEPLLHCVQCGKPFNTFDRIGIDRGNEVDGILLFHFDERRCTEKY